MAQPIGLDTTIKATESIPARLVRVRALFQLLNLWLDGQQGQDPARAMELARHLQLLAGLPSRQHAARELGQWLPERSLRFIQHDVASMRATLRKLAIGERPGCRQMLAHLDEIRWYCELALLIYKLEHDSSSTSPHLGLRHDPVTGSVELANTDPAVRRAYLDLFTRGVRVVARAATIWRELQREMRSFLARPAEPAAPVPEESRTDRLAER